MNRLLCTALVFLLPTACAEPSSPGSTGLAEPGDSSGRHAPFESACARLHGDCSSVCDSPFFECYENAHSCAAQWEADFFSDYDDPMVDEALARRCAEQVEDQACTSLEPDTLECAFALVESCTGDRDAYGRPYSPFVATSVELDEPLVIDLCPSVGEYYALELQAGTNLSIVRDDDAPAAFFTLHQMVPTDDGDHVLHRFGLEQPVPADGQYIVEVRALERGEHHLRFVDEEADE